MASEIRLYGVDETAELMGVDRMTVYRHIWDGDLAWVNIAQKGKRARIRIRESDIHTWVTRRLVPGHIA